jgi:serine/threonine-protein kinase
VASRVGTVLQGRYEIIREIATGGMGVVYRGERLKLGRKVAIKFLLGWTDSEEARTRFEREARAMGALHHPNCVTVTDFGVHEGVPYLVMDYVKGVPLDDIVADGPLPPRRVVDIARQLLAGLGHAHEQGIVHRDIKPGNIMVYEADGFDDEVKLLDFGVAKLQSDTGDLTAGMAIGTPSYMSPEQGEGEPVDARSDIYAVGVLLYYMLTGEKPFDDDDKLEVLRLHREAPRPELPRRIAPPDLAEVVKTAMAVAPGDRYQSAAEMSAALADVRELSPPALPAPAAPPPAAPVPDPAPPAGAPTPPVAAQGSTTTPVAAGPSRRGWIIAGAGLVLLIIIIVAAQSGSRAPARHPGEPAADPAAAGDEIPGLAEAIALAERDNRAGTVRLEELADIHPDDARIRYQLGRAYFRRPWWPKGLEAYRAAIERDPSLRADEPLIRDVLRAFGSTSSHRQAADFIVDVVGEPALPLLEELARTADNPRVADRASRAIQRLRGSP